MSKAKNKIDTRDSVRVVTTNDFITAIGLSSLSIKARKLLYIAIAQCKMKDDQFFYYEISVQEFADMMDIFPSNLYNESKKIAVELMEAVIKVDHGKKDYDMYNLFSTCKYREDSTILFKLNPDMTHFLLQIKEAFTKPLLQDFLKMNSSYSMAIWNLMQREMQSSKPSLTEIIEFDLSLDELRRVTGTEDKMKEISHFKQKVLDKALREIDECCYVKITYTNIKSERTVTGFHFKATNMYHIEESNLPQPLKDKCELHDLKELQKIRPLTHPEQQRFETLEDSVGQLSLVF